MNAVDWPHEQIRRAALQYIREHTAKESEWRFTCVDALGERLVRIVSLEAEERPIVTCFVAFTASARRAAADEKPRSPSLS